MCGEVPRSNSLNPEESAEDQRKFLKFMVQVSWNVKIVPSNIACRAHFPIEYAHLRKKCVLCDSQDASKILNFEVKGIPS